MQGAGCRVQGAGCRVQGSAARCHRQLRPHGVSLTSGDLLVIPRRARPGLAGPGSYRQPWASVQSLGRTPRPSSTPPATSAGRKLDAGDLLVIPRRAHPGLAGLGSHNKLWASAQSPATCLELCSYACKARNLSQGAASHHTGVPRPQENAHPPRIPLGP